MNNAVCTNDIEKRSSSLGLLTGLIFGMLAGFGTMMLLAPQSGKRTRIQIGEKSIELQNRAIDTYDDLVMLSHFDNRKIPTRTQELSENKHAGKVIENLSNQVSTKPKTKMQKMIEELLYNDSLGG
jgi:gas vesicle protein